MNAITRIQQRGEIDCGVACVAMLIQRYASCPAESSYDTALATMFGGKSIVGTDTRVLKRTLKTFNIETGYRKVPFIPRTSLQMNLKFDAIVSTVEKSDGWWHWMVWDCVTQTLLDPLHKPYRRPRVTHYLRVGLR